MNSDRRSPWDAIEQQERFDAETQREIDREERSKWKNLSTHEKLWQIGQAIVLILSVCGIGVVLDFFHLPSVFAVVLWSIIGLTLGASKFRKP